MTDSIQWINPLPPERLRAAASEYETRGAFREGNHPAYVAAITHGVLDVVCAYALNKNNPGCTCDADRLNHEKVNPRQYANKGTACDR
ncbi:hypothetical protein [Ruegeria lacuscaerulensis]|uniref:hypothetical protein n=1 Tax=Ruegeria lacuscaerulensis TaxID=55218 RepID=UPI0014819796|nr:hypothetical protein [Ruegeria lacuscaerulensis]